MGFILFLLAVEFIPAESTTTIVLPFESESMSAENRGYSSESMENVDLNESAGNRNQFVRSSEVEAPLRVRLVEPSLFRLGLVMLVLILVLLCVVEVQLWMILRE